jgi:2-C-methyl-D-erythritol 4-phosphate cytidylyltransferase
MNASPRVGAVLLAAGRGRRVGGDLPKQFLPLAGRPLFLHSVETLAGVETIREIVTVLPADPIPDSISAALSDLERRCGPIGRFARAVGGARRQDSVAAGLAALTVECDVALVHDAARPLVTTELIREVILAAARSGGALAALPCTDTIKRSGDASMVLETLDRGDLWRAQTPQALRAEFLPRLLDHLKLDLEFTDEAAALESLGVPVKLVLGSERNFKITNGEDLHRAEIELERPPTPSSSSRSL